MKLSDGYYWAKTTGDFGPIAVAGGMYQRIGSAAWFSVKHITEAKPINATIAELEREEVTV